MSKALWCDQGGHAFSERDPGRQHVSVTVVADDGSGQELQETRDMCGACAASSGLLAPRKTSAAAAPAIGAPPGPPPAQPPQPQFYPNDGYAGLVEHGTGQYAGQGG